MRPQGPLPPWSKLEGALGSQTQGPSWVGTSASMTNVSVLARDTFVVHFAIPTFTVGEGRSLIANPFRGYDAIPASTAGEGSTSIPAPSRRHGVTPTSTIGEGNNHRLSLGPFGIHKSIPPLEGIVSHNTRLPDLPLWWTSPSFLHLF